MQSLENKIREVGKVLSPIVLKVDAFLNHQIDAALMKAVGEEFAARFSDVKATKILTLESSGIAPATMLGLVLGLPVIFARKRKSLTLSDNLLSATVHSFTKNVTSEISVSRDFLKAGDQVIIIDDFLANGEAVRGLLSVVEQADATAVGVGIVIEKGFQHGGKELREKGVRVESLAIVDSMDVDHITFRQQD
ncbi:MULTISPECIES: xanthine phosphoribosyltransferase [Vitreoscilla]|uniref:Xanthine phosphoribosyltransferase n=1 Tax=Vitreoscilla stercoraria TaxID=61 RepID=A0ABY4EIB0_VITST|nr:MULTISPECIES: xanthine phosphoribosyltransferase [Vitreoscilla]AUZ04018.1 xanthine phosphoribosyltransferase [Vitreoscilla sp. C1]UOO93117.1 xanthine phosphoribosyltransferase [Vitreoscilla stercoraria]